MRVGGQVSPSVADDIRELDIRIEWEPSQANVTRSRVYQLAKSIETLHLVRPNCIPLSKDACKNLVPHEIFRVDVGHTRSTTFIERATWALCEEVCENTVEEVGTVDLSKLERGLIARQPRVFAIRAGARDTILHVLLLEWRKLVHSIASEHAAIALLPVRPMNESNG
jgi:hypothetical protein